MGMHYFLKKPIEKLELEKLLSRYFKWKITTNIKIIYKNYHIILFLYTILNWRKNNNNFIVNNFIILIIV